MPKCLIVDDSPTIRRLIRRIFEDLGYQCAEAEDGRKALDVVSGHMPDLIMLDWNMPVMNGFEFLQHLRQMDQGKSPKVIFCTTESSMESILKGMQGGADEYIMKPFDKETIAAKLAMVG